MEMMVGKKIQPSKDYGARIVHRIKKFRPVDEILPNVLKKFANNVTLFSPKQIKGIINYYSSRRNFLKRTPKNYN